MNKIIQLPPDVISQIAAGEVIERPAYAVKELIENAIDAKANYIRIDIEKSGLQKIMVTDNGIGMNKDDLQLAFLPHTTSKLQTVQDLQDIQSLGFRGEALSSIAAISDLTIKTKPKESVAGMMIKVINNKVFELTPVGMSQGTTVTVENLFSNIPARKKFLKSLQTEYRLLLQTILHLALAHPEIHFFVTNNQQTVLDLPTQTLSERLITVLGKSTAHYLIPLSKQESYVQINGFLSKPQLSQTTQNKNFLFVNNRTIKDSAIAKTVRQAYGTLLPPQSNPIFVLFLHLPTGSIDVNVHPKKEEVRFHDSELVHTTLFQAVSEALQQHNLTFQDQRWNKTPVKSSLLENFTVREGNTATYGADLLREDIKPYTINDEQLPIDDVMQLNNLYILTQTKHGLVLIDQHAAHERILYEQLLKSFQKEKYLTKQTELERTVLIELGQIEKEILEENIELFNRHGFDIAHFVGNTYKISTVPEFFKDRNIEELLHEMIEDMYSYNSIKAIDVRSQRMLTYIACRSAVKSGDALTKDQMKEIVQTLQQTNNNATCPHGRPTKIMMTFSDLNRLFHRSK